MPMQAPPPTVIVVGDGIDARRLAGTSTVCWNYLRLRRSVGNRSVQRGETVDFIGRELFPPNLVQQI